jgi:uncharacterized repeat protein (TIGR01451 family)
MSQTRRWLAARYLLALGLVLAGSCLLTACGNEGGASPAAPTVDATTTAASEVIARALGTPLLQGDHVATAVAATLTASAPTVSPTATATPAPPTPDATRIAAVIGTQVATEFRATLTAAAAAATPIVAHTPVPTTPATPTAAPTRTATDTPTPIPTTPAPPTPELTRTAAAVATQLAGEARATMAAEATNTARAQATATADVRASGTAIAQTKATATTLAAAIGTQVAAELRATLTVEAKQTERAQTASTPILLPTESSTLTAITTAPITVWSSTAITPVTNFVTSTVQQPSGGLADIEIGQYGSLTVGVGEAITYTIIVTNNGPAAANDVWVVNALPEGISFIRLMSSQGICSGPTCALGPLALHGTVTITVVGMVSRSVAERTELVKATWVDSASIDPLRGNNFTYSTTFVNSTGQGAAAVAVNLETDATPTPMSTESVAVMAGQVFTDHHATLPAETVQPEQALASLTTATPRPSEMSTSLPTVTLSSVPTSLPSPHPYP